MRVGVRGKLKLTLALNLTSILTPTLTLSLATLPGIFFYLFVDTDSLDGDHGTSNQAMFNAFRAIKLMKMFRLLKVSRPGLGRGRWGLGQGRWGLVQGRGQGRWSLVQGRGQGRC